MEETVQILDHGYLKFIEHWGSDIRIVEAARMSTDKGFLGWTEPPYYECPSCKYRADASIVPRLPLGTPPLMCMSPAHAGQNFEVQLITPPRGDEKLLEHLYTRAHMSPFEMAGMVIEVQAPIMVFREWHRHRTQSYNELSARYTPLPDVNYLPTKERCFMVSATNRQAAKIKGAPDLTHDAALDWLEKLAEVYAHAQNVYQMGLDIGLPKEVARLPVPVGRYSRMRASANLRNWMAFLTLRQAADAQWEIRQFANEMAKIVKLMWPRTYEIFLDHQHA